MIAPAKKNQDRHSRALHHIIVRGIEKGIIFEDDWDLNRFLDRLGSIVEETGTRCLAYTLIPNHAHLLPKTGRVPAKE